MIEAVLFDLGGVLLEMGPERGLPWGRLDWRGRQALLARLRRRRRSLELEDLETLLFRPWRADHEHRYERVQEADWTPHLDRLRQRTGSADTDLELLATWFEPYAESLRPAPAARETLVRLAGAGLRLGLISNVPLPGALYRPALERSGLADFLASVHFSYDAGSRKPSPKMLLAALSVLGVAPGRAVMVGDRRPSDVAAGRAAGTRTVLLRAFPAPGPAADAEIDELSELPAVLAAW